MPLTVSEISEQLARSGLVASAVLRRLQQEDQNLVDDENGELLVKRLVQAGTLTPFQAQLVVRGKSSSLIIGNYFLVDKLGQGGMGQVFKARHRTMKRDVALKVISQNLVRDQSSIRRFQREVEAAARLNHPNIVTAHDAGQQRGIHFLVMELVSGRNLDTIVRDSGPMNCPEALNCILQTAQGLAFAHQRGIVHRDIKPANLLRDHDGNIKILDMGLARLNARDEDTGDASALTGTGVMMGTIDYMAPEQALDSRNADARADIYSLGCTLYFLLTARPVFEEETLMKRLMAHQSEVRPPLPTRNIDLQRLFERMTDRDPGARYQSMSDVITDLESLIRSFQSQSGSPHGSIDCRRPGFSATRYPDLGKSSSASDPRPNSALSAGNYGTMIPPSPEADISFQGLTEKLAEKLPDVRTGPVISNDSPGRGRPFRTSANPHRGPRPTHSHGKLLPIAGGTVLMLILLGIIVITITNRKTEETTIRVPEGMGIRAEPGAGVAITHPEGVLSAASVRSDSAAAGMPSHSVRSRPVDPAVERKVAEWALSIGAQISTEAAGQTQFMGPGDRLPETDFVVTSFSTRPGSQSQSLTDDGLIQLYGLSSLRSLTLLNCRSITDTGVTTLKALPGLERLDLAFAPVTDACVDGLVSLKRLTWIGVGETFISDEGIRRILHELPELQYLQLSAPTTEACLTAIPDHPNLTTLSGLKPHHLSARAVESLNRNSRVNTLNIVGATDDTLALVCQLQFVKELSLNLAEFSREGLLQLVVNPGLTVLNLSDSPRVTAEYLKVVAQMPGIRKLYVTTSATPGSGVSGFDLSQFSQSRSDVEIIADGRMFEPSASEIP